MRFTSLSIFVLPVIALSGVIATPSPKVLRESTTITRSIVSRVTYPNYNALIFCTELDCAGNCVFAAIDFLEPDYCYLTGFLYNSFMGYSPTGEPFPEAVFAGHDDCDYGQQLKSLGVCQNVYIEENGILEPGNFNSYFTL